MTDHDLRSDEPPPSNASFFAGRQALYARLQQQIFDPPTLHARVFLGHDGMGKTALLQHFPLHLPASILSLYIPLHERDLTSEAPWLQSLVEAINRLLLQRGFSVRRIPEQPDDERPLREWFREDYLPAVLGVIRAHRRLVLLLDDAEGLLTLPDGHCAYWHSILQAHPQISLVLTLNTRHEARLDEFVPLIMPTAAERLHRLPIEAIDAIVQQAAPSTEASFVQKIAEASGGHPQLVQRFAQELTAQRETASNEETWQRIKKAVYQASKPDFDQSWKRLNRDERLVLTALASLLYDDPLQTVQVPQIERWLLDSDFLLDSTAIHAALRGLDYQDMLTQQQGEGVRMVMGLQQQWLLEYARLDEIPAQPTPPGQRSFWWLWAAIVLLVLVVLLVLLLQNPAVIEGVPTVPTVTLEP